MQNDFMAVSVDKTLSGLRNTRDLRAEDGLRADLVLVLAHVLKLDRESRRRKRTAP